MKNKGIVKITNKSGRVYEYDYSIPRKGRKKTKHHPDFKYKEYPLHKIKSRDPYFQCLERDNYTCQMCGVSPDNRRLLNIHHKDNNGYGKTNKPNNSLDNLITLCNKCHLKLHYGVFDRNKEIVQLRQAGITLEVIGKQFGVSRQRIFQIIQKNT